MCSSQNRSLSFKTDKSFCGEEEVAAYISREKSANCLQEKRLHKACNESWVSHRTMTRVRRMPFDLQATPEKFQGCLHLQISSRGISVAASHFKKYTFFQILLISLPIYACGCHEKRQELQLVISLLDEEYFFLFNFSVIELFMSFVPVLCPGPKTPSSPSCLLLSAQHSGLNSDINRTSNG